MRSLVNEVMHLSDPIGRPRQVRHQVNNETPMFSLPFGSLTLEPDRRDIARAWGRSAPSAFLGRQPSDACKLTRHVVVPL
jgi:hypothetical protein